MDDISYSRLGARSEGVLRSCNYRFGEADAVVWYPAWFEILESNTERRDRLYAAEDKSLSCSDPA